MALTYSADVNPQFHLPEFRLPETRGGWVSSQDLKRAGKPSLVTFICNHCPYVKAIENRLISLGHVLTALGVPMLAISSNDASAYPEDSFENMQKKSYPFPYAYDESQDVAKAFEALCTPEFYLFNSQGYLRYRGRLDNNWKEPHLVTRMELLEAVIQLLHKDELNLDFPIQSSMGCSMKWRA